MPQVGAAIALAWAAAAAAPAAGTGLLAGLYGTSALTGIGALAFKAFAQVAIGTGLSYLAKALAPKPEATRLAVGSRVQFTLGEDVPETIILGRYATPGHVVYAGSQGEFKDAPNAVLTTVSQLSCFPATLRRIMTSGQWVTRGGRINSEYGTPVNEYEVKGRSFLWHDFFDGTQTEASARLLGLFGSAETRPWQSDMIGRGCAYVVESALSAPTLHRGRPTTLYELNGAPLYDPRKDTTVGGSGTHRLDDQTTWETSDNPVVMIYNLMVGLRDPITDELVFGGILPREEFTLEQWLTYEQRMLPVAYWFAAMNACDVVGSNGNPVYRAGIEIPLSDDYTPADAIDVLLGTCLGRMAEVMGEWHIKAGPPPASSYAFTDEDVIITESDELDPFPGLDASYNAITSTYVNPNDGWRPRSTPERRSTAYLEQDKGRLNMASPQRPAVWDGIQAQRLDKSELLDHRRMRRHVVMLPPDCRVGPLDVVSWTSEWNGYSNKKWFADMVDVDLMSGCVLLSLREVDPNDYDFGSSDELDDPVGYSKRLPTLPLPIDFSVEAAWDIDSPGAARRAGIRMNWNPDVSEITGVRYTIRVAAQPDHPPVIGGADFSDEDLTEAELMSFPGEPVEATPGEIVLQEVTSEFPRGTLVTSADILPDTSYEVRMRYRRAGKDGPWSTWMPVHTFDLRYGEKDIEEIIISAISEAEAKAETARLTSEQALELAQEAANVTGTVGRLLGGGWVKEASFSSWLGDTAIGWTTAGPLNVQQNSSGYFENTAAELIAPGNLSVGLSATYLSGQMNDFVDLNQPYVVMSLMFQWVSGIISSGFARVSWWNGSAWVPGTFPLAATTTGQLDKLGLRSVVNLKQLPLTIIKRPTGVMSDIKLEIFAGTTLNASPLRFILHSFDVRNATDSEIAAINAQTYVDAQIDELQIEINGINEAHAADMLTLNARVDGNEASILDVAAVSATADAALASRLISVEAVNDGNNLVRNGQFLDGVRAAGVTPDFWRVWDSSWEIVALGDTAKGTCMGWCPAPFALRIPFNASDRTTGTAVGAGSAQNLFLCQENDIIKVRFNYCTAGGTTSAELYVRLQFRDSALNTLGEGSFGVTTSTKANPWPLYESNEIKAPAGTAVLLISLRREPGGGGFGFMTNVEVRKADPTLNSRLQSVFGFKAVAGPSEATMELVALKDGSLETSIARIKAKHILLDGEVFIESGFAEELVTKLLLVDTAYINNANIVNASVDRLKIGDREVTTNSTAITTGTVTLSLSDQSVQSITVVSPSNAIRRVHFSVRQSWAGGVGGYAVELQRSYNGSAWSTRETLNDLSYSDPRDANALPVSYTHVDTSVDGGTYDYRLVARAEDYGSGYVTNPRIRQRMLSVDVNMR